MIQMADQIAHAEATDSVPPPGAILFRLIDSVLDWLRTRGPEQ